jgi:hypothetical protein
MNLLERIFKIVEENNCPYYSQGDEFGLSGNALLLKLKEENTFITTAIARLPNGRQSCSILISDLTKILIANESIDKIPSSVIDCSGCKGKIKLKTEKPEEIFAAADVADRRKNIDVIANLLSNFSIFQSLDRHNLKDIVPFLKLKKFDKNATILKKGAPAQNLYIILSGAVDVLDEKGVRLSTLRKGDVFGEMSLISGDPVGATIRVVETATIVFIKGEDFKEVLDKFPSIQMYLARLLARRLANANVERAEEVASGMIGQLSEMPPSELLQVLNINQKTGVLSLNLPRGSAELHFREGELVGAKYNEMSDKEAFFEILKEKEGRFKFDKRLSEKQKTAPIIGSFMEILLDGLKRVDEEIFPNEDHEIICK